MTLFRSPIRDPKIFAAGLAALAFACGAPPQTTETPTDPAGTQAEASPHKGGTLVVGFDSEPDSLNIYLARKSNSQLLAHRVLPRLAVEQLPDERHEAGLFPQLAEDWTIEGNKVTFKLRKGGTWSDGAPITCKDVQFTLKAQTDPKLAWRGASIKRHIQSVECPNDHTAVFTFDKSYPGMVMDANDLHILPASLSEIPIEQWREVSWEEKMVTAGPFKYAEYDADQQIVLDRKEDFYGNQAQPYLDRIVMRIVKDDSARVTQLLSGDLDVILRLSPRDARRVEESGLARVERRPGSSYTYMGYNVVDPSAYRTYRSQREKACASKKIEPCLDVAEEVAALGKTHPHPLFGDARVRRALTMGIDRETLVDTLLSGEAQIMAGPILPSLPHHDPALQPWPFDPAQAKKLLASAGFADSDGDGVLEKNGVPFSFEVYVAAGKKLRRDAAVLIQRDLAKIGVKVEIKPIEDSTFYSTLAKHEMDAWLGAWSAPLRVDMTEMLHAQACGSGGLNFGLFSEDEMDAMASHARDLVDDQERYAGWRAWEKEFHLQQPYTILYLPHRLIGVRKNVRGTQTALANDELAGIESWWIDPS